jgi:ArsR family transcriptional regulator
VFKAVGDPVRVQLLSIIATYDGEPCVCELTKPFDLSGPTISHHLKVLRNVGLIDCRRRGTWIHYWVVPERLADVSSILDIGQAPLVDG